MVLPYHEKGHNHSFIYPNCMSTEYDTVMQNNINKAQKSIRWIDLDNIRSSTWIECFLKKNMRLVRYMSMTRAFTNHKSSFRVTFHRSGPGNFAVLFLAPWYGDGWFFPAVARNSGCNVEHKLELKLWQLWSGWWFQPISKIWSQMGSCPPSEGRIQQMCLITWWFTNLNIEPNSEGGRLPPYKPWIWSYKNPPFPDCLSMSNLWTKTSRSQISNTIEIKSGPCGKNLHLSIALHSCFSRQKHSVANFADPHLCPQDSTSPTLRETTMAMEWQLKKQPSTHVVSTIWFKYDIASTCGLFNQEGLAKVSTLAS